MARARLLLLWFVALQAAAEESAFKSSGRYDTAMEVRLAADPAIALVGTRTLGAEVTGGVAASVRFYVDGELVGTDESEPFETRYDFGPTPRRREIVVVALTASGTKSKRIFVTSAEGMLDPASLAKGTTTAAAALPAPGAAAPPAAAAGAAPEAASVAPSRAPSDPAPARAGTAGGLSVVILEPFGDAVSGLQNIVVDARAREPERVARVEIFVDGILIRSLSAPPWEARHDFGDGDRPAEVKAVAYGAAGDAVSATWRAAGRRGAAPAGGGQLRVTFVTPKDGDYLAGPVTFAVTVKEVDGPVTRVDFFVDGSLAGTVTRPPWELSWDAGQKVAAHTVKAHAYDGNGRRAQAVVQTRALDVAFTEEVREVVLTASFTDRQGRPVTDVTQAEVVVKEDGKEQAVTGFRAEERPIALAIVLDASGSMKDKLERTRIAAAQFVDQLAPADQALVIAFSEKPAVLCEATSDKARLKQAIASVSLGTSTALHDAIHLAVERLVKVEGDVRRAMVVLSDGMDSGPQGGSQKTYEEAERRALTADVRCYTIDLTRSMGAGFKAMGASPWGDGGSNLLKGLADQTGGESFVVEALVELAGTYAQVAQELRRQYWITYRPSNERKDGRWREIEVESRDRKLIVRTRAGYHAPGKAR